ncbi:hypothetical protein CH373_01920 [Leptospira perolatii]|uniref:DUF898 domain-containing protein n=1 Tax=Leptospira perolatii TaxID=2023191 RepID=A0A2M9ZRU6_9LEPT|nr:DUF898 family protein [Leptospira perolatii]PJZ71284.1 hypothetical protein CH360_01920 [Leptospira perolatii]PJZ74818.1 hypothetical protein CH373_01920 [Leptospira perolatii]
MNSVQDTRLQFDGKGKDLFVIYLSNALTTIVTIGIYYFWATVKTTKYLHQHLIFQGHRFDFHATGKEKFIGFLKALVLFVGVYIIIALLQWVLTVILSAQVAAILSALLIVAVLLALIPFVIIGSRRYYLSRTSFNNIRFHFAGHPLELVKIYVPGVLLSIITFGIYTNWLTVKLQKFYMSNTYYGNASFQFEGKGLDLLLINLKGFFLTVITAGIYSSWYTANLQNYIYNHTSFNGIRLRSDLRGGRIFLLTLYSILLILITVGIAVPWIAVRWIKLYLEAISLEVSPDLSAIRPDFDRGASPLADGMESVASLADALSNFLG